MCTINVWELVCICERVLGGCIIVCERVWGFMYVSGRVY